MNKHIFFFRCVDSVSDCKKLFSTLIDSCFTVAQLVSPVVTNASPEGNVPVGQLGYLGLLGSWKIFYSIFNMDTNVSIYVFVFRIEIIFE